MKEFKKRIKKSDNSSWMKGPKLTEEKNLKSKSQKKSWRIEKTNILLLQDKKKKKEEKKSAWLRFGRKNKGLTPYIRIKKKKKREKKKRKWKETDKRKIIVNKKKRSENRRSLKKNSAKFE